MLHNKLLQPQRLLPSPAVLILGSSLESCSVCVQCADERETTQAFAKALDLQLPGAVQKVWRTWSEEGGSGLSQEL